MEEDLEMLAGLAGGDGDEMADAEAAEIEMLVAMVQPPQQGEKRHAQRSWQLMEKARAAKQARSQDTEIARAEAGRVKAERDLSSLSSLCPAAAAILRIPRPRGEMDEARAQIVALLALSPTVSQETRRQRGASMNGSLTNVPRISRCRKQPNVDNSHSPCEINCGQPACREPARNYRLQLSEQCHERSCPSPSRSEEAGWND